MESDKIGMKIGAFKIIKPIDDGCIGSVYCAKREGDINEYRAIKLIPKDSLRLNWENEIRKVVELGHTQGVVRYHEHGWTDAKDYLWISWDYIPGKSLKNLIENNQVSVPLLYSIVETILIVLHACKSIYVQHGDLHSGNILIENASHLNIDENLRKVWITDFGYCTASIGKEMLDDYLGLARIIGECIKTIDFHKIGGEDKHLYRVLKNEFPKYLTETNSTQGMYVRNPRELLHELHDLADLNLSSPIQQEQHIADYLAAELIGERYDEWKALFVPEFLGSSTLLDRNICVVTGLRGCGKTMIFRRLTALFDAHLGPSGVPLSDTFMGFYLNARNIAEAFPWLPDEFETVARNQVIHFFHVSWCLEIINWLEEENKSRDFDLKWLFDFFKKYINLTTEIITSYQLSILRTIFIAELDSAKLSSGYERGPWALTDLNFLELLSKEISQKCKWIGVKPFYFFVDDYSTPLISPPIQRILNAIIFRRSSNSIFKVATESSESFFPIGLNGKKLEENDDYVLVDFGMQALLEKESANKKILSSVLAPRINRNKNLKDRNLTLDSILGKSTYNNNQLALQLKKEDEDIKKIAYHGMRFFSAMWSSDIREMIRIFANMVSLEEDSNLMRKPKKSLITKEVQNKVMREAGSRFMSLLEAATNPSDKMYQIENSDKSYGEHLVKIARSFQEVASFELKTKTSKNIDSTPVKQARRIELTEVGNLPSDLYDYYVGMIRYGLFTKDTRGKSVRGKIVPRLYLRGLLIPYFTLTFSKRDSISMNWEKFCYFLREPEEFSEKWQQGDLKEAVKLNVKKEEQLWFPGFEK